MQLQSLQSDPPAHDELLFIVVHQVYELWFKQILCELESIRAELLDDNPSAARHLLERVMVIEDVAVTQIRVLETMAPKDFLEFRMELAPASGFQSVQFREIEFISGLKDESYLDRVSEDAEERARLEKRLDEPTLWDAFCTFLDRRNLPMPRDDEEGRRTTLLEVARNRARYPDEYYVSEALLEHDQHFAVWRSRHVLMVERQIGTKSGTGGSTGAPYLRSTLNKRFYPELWDLRSYL